MKKKVLYVITKSNWGGAQRYVFDLATSLPKDKFDVVVACGDSRNKKDGLPGLLVQRLVKNGTRIILIPSFTRDISILRDFSALRELISVFRAEHPDVVHLNSSKAGGIGALAARITGVNKIVFTAHGWPFWEARNPVVRAAIWFASYLTALLCDTAICISNYDLAQVRYMPGVRAVCIYNGVAPLAPGSGARIRSAFPAGVKIVGTIGELNKNKNQIALIEQARHNPHMYVAIIGEGELHSYLQSKIDQYKLGDRVKLFGFILQHDALRGFDEFALPSIKEGLPYVLIDAKQAGLPIVANRVGGVGEILDAKDLKEFSLEQMVQKTTTLYLS